MVVKSGIEAVREAIREEMERDPKVFVMGEDVGVRGGVFLATQGMSEEFGADRVIDTPLAEASIMGIALGAAFRGMRPIPEVQFFKVRQDIIYSVIHRVVGVDKGGMPVHQDSIRSGVRKLQNTHVVFF